MGNRLELDGYDPRGLYIPLLPGLESLSIKDVGDAEDWLEELMFITTEEEKIVERATAGVPEAGKTAVQVVETETEPEQEQEQDEDEDEGESVSRGKTRFPSLRYLSLPSTNLFSLPFALPCTLLTHLDLASNLLNSIPSVLASLEHLESLNLSNNMIESVRGAEAVIPRVRALNLRANRVDCLAGLDRLERLERVDVRKNRLYDSSEVGRLALCPRIREVWVGTSSSAPGSGNPFVDTEGEAWREKVFTAFVEEGREGLLLDGYEMTWGGEEGGYGGFAETREEAGKWDGSGA